MAWLNLEKSGPLMIEMPAGRAAGFVNDLWQRPVTDMGQPGPDKGQGGKFLGSVRSRLRPRRAEGYIVVRSTTFNNLWLVRLLSPDAQEREALLPKIRLYPLASARPLPLPRCSRWKAVTTFANAPRGLAYWEKLSRWINEEPVQERDRMMMGMPKSIGIEKGKPFHPDARMTKMLTEATLVGEAMAKANDYEKRDMPLAHYAVGSKWVFKLCLDPSQEALITRSSMRVPRGFTKPPAPSPAW